MSGLPVDRGRRRLARSSAGIAGAMFAVVLIGAG
jgi:hypothetical protein